jgi:hypothetical protein
MQRNSGHILRASLFLLITHGLTPTLSWLGITSIVQRPERARLQSYHATSYSASYCPGFPPLLASRQSPAFDARKCRHRKEIIFPKLARTASSEIVPETEAKPRFTQAPALPFQTSALGDLINLANTVLEESYAIMDGERNLVDCNNHDAMI